ncbi:MAG: hypothetical protein CL920_21520 [Deltaproteobacteria bacterium]|nr:hypothetical protein [Deltaproteobacteria bacterium]MBU51277.1 hypothetical protein [Deltaproteobacteria bacterium]
MLLPLCNDTQGQLIIFLKKMFLFVTFGVLYPSPMYKKITAEEEFLSAPPNTKNVTEKRK